MRVERSARIAAPPKRVYDLVMDPSCLESWVTIHHHLETAPAGPLEQGSKLTQCLKLAGRKFNVHWTVVENDPCRRVVWEGRGPVASHAKVIYEFDSADGGGTDFLYTNEYELPGGPLGRVAGKALSRVTARELDESLARLRRLAE